MNTIQLIECDTYRSPSGAFLYLTGKLKLLLNFFIQTVLKLDRVGPVDNRPSTD